MLKEVLVISSIDMVSSIIYNRNLRNANDCIAFFERFDNTYTKKMLLSLDDDIFIQGKEATCLIQDKVYLGFIIQRDMRQGQGEGKIIGSFDYKVLYKIEYDKRLSSTVTADSLRKITLEKINNGYTDIESYLLLIQDKLIKCANDGLDHLNIKIEKNTNKSEETVKFLINHFSEQGFIVTHSMDNLCIRW